MPNQYTKRNTNRATKVAGAYEKTKRAADNHAGIHVIPLPSDFMKVLFGAAMSPKPDPTPETNGCSTGYVAPAPASTPLMNRCDQKAKFQPHFTLLPSDNFTPGLVKKWISDAIINGVPDQKILEAKAILSNIEEWRRANPTACKTPD